MSESQPADGEETFEEKRARVLERLGEILRADPPDLSGSGSGPVTASGFPVLPETAEEFDQESASRLFEALTELFHRSNKRPGEAGPEASERE